MKINNDEYGGFIVSKNILSGKKIGYSFREESKIAQLNGWTLYSVDDDDEYVSDPKNFVILSASSIIDISEKILEIFSAPYGTDLCWLYEDEVHVGFYDLKNDAEVTIEQILNP